METLQKVHNSKLTEYIALYLQHKKNPDQEQDKSELILLNQARLIIIDMRDSGVVPAIIFSYFLTVAQLLSSAGRYNIVDDYKKLDTLLGLLYDDEITKKRHLSQLIVYVTKGNLNMSQVPHIQEKIKELVSSTLNN